MKLYIEDTATGERFLLATLDDEGWQANEEYELGGELWAFLNGTTLENYRVLNPRDGSTLRLVVEE